MQGCGDGTFQLTRYIWTSYKHEFFKHLVQMLNFYSLILITYAFRHFVDVYDLSLHERFFVSQNCLGYREALAFQ